MFISMLNCLKITQYLAQVGLFLLKGVMFSSKVQDEGVGGSWCFMKILTEPLIVLSSTVFTGLHPF